MSPMFFPLVCDDTCREVIMDPNDEQLVCRISGHCFDTLLLPDSMEPDTVSTTLLQMLPTLTSLIFLLLSNSNILTSYQSAHFWKTENGARLINGVFYYFFRLNRWIAAISSCFLSQC